jgi:hypothetical protein
MFDHLFRIILEVRFFLFLLYSQMTNIATLQAELRPLLRSLQDSRTAVILDVKTPVFLSEFAAVRVSSPIY